MHFRIFVCQLNKILFNCNQSMNISVSPLNILYFWYRVYFFFITSLGLCYRNPNYMLYLFKNHFYCKIGVGQYSYEQCFLCPRFQSSFYFNFELCGKCGTQFMLPKSKTQTQRSIQEYGCCIRYFQGNGVVKLLTTDVHF